MTVSELSAPQRFSLTLDPSLVLERLILRRLPDLKRKRGQDWLRALLIQGFLMEGQWLRRECPSGSGGGARREHKIPPTDFARWLEGSMRSPQRTPEPAPVTRVQATPSTRPAGEKPFAHLRKVIG